MGVRIRDSIYLGEPTGVQVCGPGLDWILNWEFRYFFPSWFKQNNVMFAFLYGVAVQRNTAQDCSHTSWWLERAMNLQPHRWQGHLCLFMCNGTSFR
jgi:hypothetical protein